MTSISLGASYLTKAATRLKVLDLLLSEQAYSDVVREAQEVVELALKGVLHSRRGPAHSRVPRPAADRDSA